ncbi:hypothetical protein FPV67DRAFT_797302 [Lyophyllum atratum]|nr:hypothetical protein FPV67DRAFT_797302 [Lyophyllum atratum]
MRRQRKTRRRRRWTMGPRKRMGRIWRRRCSTGVSPSFSEAKTFETTGAVSVYNGDAVKSDTAVSDSLKEALKAAAAPLEEVPARGKDWHPESDDKVLCLVHPSLFLLIYGAVEFFQTASLVLVIALNRVVKE